MIYVGLDVHKAFSSMEALNPATGEVWECDRVTTDLAGLRDALAQVPSPKTVVLEAGRNSLYLAALLEPLAQQGEQYSTCMVSLLSQDGATTGRHICLNLI